jgi:hypothetical protein
MVAGVSTSRRFCRFTRSAEGNAHGLRWEESDGLCLSSFLVLTDAAEPYQVLVGKINPTGPWDHLAGLEPERVRLHMGGWILPASQLLLRESPDEAAHRLLAEMLGGIDPTLEAPRVMSEVYAPRLYPDARQHWDLSFLYLGRWDGPAPQLPNIWHDLRFVDVRETPRSAFARSHDEVLDSVGLSPK